VDTVTHFTPVAVDSRICPDVPTEAEPSVKVPRIDMPVSFRLPEKSPAAPLPIAKEATPRREMPESEFQPMTVPEGLLSVSNAKVPVVEGHVSTGFPDAGFTIVGVPEEVPKLNSIAPVKEVPLFPHASEIKPVVLPALNIN